jgi:hypothetical protein
VTLGYLGKIGKGVPKSLSDNVHYTPKAATTSVAVGRQAGLAALQAPAFDHLTITTNDRGELTRCQGFMA